MFFDRYHERLLYQTIDLVRRLLKPPELRSVAWLRRALHSLDQSELGLIGHDLEQALSRWTHWDCKIMRFYDVVL